MQKIFERANSIIQTLKANDNEQGALSPSTSEWCELSAFLVAADNTPKSDIHPPKSESIDSQFRNRLIYTIAADYTDDQRSLELYWLGIPPPSLLDEADYVQDESATNPDETHDKVGAIDIRLVCS